MGQTQQIRSVGLRSTWTRSSRGRSRADLPVERPGKRETQTIPIVMATSNDPVATGWWRASRAPAGMLQGSALLSGDQWKAAGAAEGSRPRAFPRGVSLESRRPRGAVLDYREN